jgi:tyrosyl-tRNA synthetase
MTLRDDLEFRGLVHQVTDDSVIDRLSAGGVTVYAGFDPTAPSLHLGHLLQLCNLRRLQMAGNRPIALAGGGTGLIGDPSFRDDERNLLTQDQLDANIAGIRVQLGRFLDFDESAGSCRALLLDNAAWLTTIALTDFLRDVGKHFTVNQMIAKDSVRSRLERPDVGISFTEFSYMLLQAYDFLRLHIDHGCTLQIGGSDQWGNIVGGAELIRRVTGEAAFGLTSPLLTTPDGQKYGKTTTGGQNIWLDETMTSPYQMHQFLLNADDAMVPTLLRFFTFLDAEEILALDEATRSDPASRRAQRVLAHEVVALVHGDEEARRAERAGEVLFSEAIRELDESALLELIGDAPSSSITREELSDGVSVVELLVRTDLAASRGEARRYLDQGGVYVNNVRTDGSTTTTASQFLHGRYLVLRRGRRQTHLLVLT